MFRIVFGARPIVEESQRISAGVCVRNYLLVVKEHALIGDKRFDLNDEESVKSLLENIEAGTTFNLKQEKYGNIEFSEQNRAKLTYTKSNLGKGYIFWFICNLCERRVRFLYIPSSSQILACRICHRLAYDKQNESKRFRRLNRLFR